MISLNCSMCGGSTLEMQSFQSSGSRGWVAKFPPFDGQLEQ
jgi:hypothetical protein